MRKRVAGGRVLLITLDRRSSRPLYQQIQDALRSAIEGGRLPAGSALPSTRALANDLGIARTTVVQAYAHLRADGLLSTRTGGATSVVRRIPQLWVQAPARRRHSRKTPSRTPTLPARSQSLVELRRQLRLPVGANVTPRPFVTAQPAIDVFPAEIWGRIVGRVWRRTPARALGYADPRGLPELRKAVASYLVGARGLHCSPEQILIVQGAQQAIDLVARATLVEGDRAWVEDPGYAGARMALAASGAVVVPVPVDEEGLVVAEGLRRAPKARLAFVTPARQIPLGGLMSLARRHALLAWAGAEPGRWVLEDDYDSEFRYVSAPVAALQALDRSSCVIHVGTWTKLLYPSLRLGYMVVPESLIDICVAFRLASDMSSPYLEQAVMTDFIGGGHLDRHIRRLRASYRSRLEVITAEAARHLPGLATLERADAGRTVVVWLEPGITESAAATAAMAAGVIVTPLSHFCIDPYPRAGLVLGYAGLRDDEIRDGMVKLATALRRARRAGRDA